MKIYIGDQVPDKIIAGIPDTDFTYRTSFTNAIINSGWEIEIVSPTTIHITKYKINTWGIKVSGILKYWRLKVTGISNQSFPSKAYFGSSGYNIAWNPTQFTSGANIQGMIAMPINRGGDQGEATVASFHPWDCGTRVFTTDGILTGLGSDGSYRQTCIGIYGGTTQDIIDCDITVELLPNNAEWKPYEEESWTAKKDDSTCLKNKTVENCLKEYYEGYISTQSWGDVIVLPNKQPTYLDNTSAKYKLPPASEIVDLYDYDLTKIAWYMNATADDYVDWMNNYYEELFNECKNYTIEQLMPYALQAKGHYKSMHLLNPNNPLRVIVPAANPDREDQWVALDGIIRNGISTNSTIQHLQLVIRHTGQKFSTGFSTGFRLFQSFRGNLDDIIHEDVDGNVVLPKDVNWGFRPTQFNATFSNAQIPIVKKDWFNISRLCSLAYAFDNNSYINEWQAYEGSEIVISPTNISVNHETYKWPYYYNENKVGVADGASLTQAFAGCSNLTRIEPIINVTYLGPLSRYRAFEIPKVTHLRLKGLNSFDWDFTSSQFNLKSLDTESVKYIFDNLTDIVTIKYDEANVDVNNVHSSYPDLLFDHINFRSNKSNLIINCPLTWWGLSNSIITYRTGGESVGYNKSNITIRFTDGQTDIVSPLRTTKSSFTNFKFKVSGLLEGDTFAIINGDNKLNMSDAIFTCTEDGEYTIETITTTGTLYFRVYNEDNTLVDPVTLELISEDDSVSKITQDMIDSASAKGWIVKINGYEIS